MEIGFISSPEKPTDSLKISVFFRVLRAFDSRFEPLILQLEISKTTTDFNAIIAFLMEAERRMGPKDPLKEIAFSAGMPRDKAPESRKPRGFQGNCYNCNKYGHRASACKLPKKESAGPPIGPPIGPSTGPLATPGGGKGLSPDPEFTWLAATEPVMPTPLLWVIDSGASRHMTYAREAFSEYTPLVEPISITTANGASIQALGQGTIPIKISVKGLERTVALTEVLHVPGLAGSLISVSQLQDRRITIRTTLEFNGYKGHYLLLERQGSLIGVAERLGKQYALLGSSVRSFMAVSSIKAPETKRAPEPIDILWHRRFGHLSLVSLENL